MCDQLIKAVCGEGFLLVLLAVVGVGGVLGIYLWERHRNKNAKALDWKQNKINL